MTDLSDALPATERAVPVADGDTHELLAELIDAIGALRGRAVEPAPTADASIESIGRLEARLILLAEALEDIAARPLPAPEVRVAPPELPAEIGALMRQLLVRLQEPATAGLDDKTIKAMMDLARPVIGGSGSARTEVQLRNKGGTVIDPAVQTHQVSANTKLDQIRRGITDYETRLDYDARTDSNPVYLGKAENGTLVSAASWTIQKFTYDASDRVTRIEVVGDVAWDDRATSF